MTSPTFYRKLKHKSFTTDELLKIAKIIKPDEYLDYMIEKSREDIKQGRVYSSEEVKRLMTKKFLNY